MRILCLLSLLALVDLSTALPQVPVFEDGALFAPGAAAADRLGDEFAVDSDWLCAGIPERSTAGLTRSGAAYAWPRVGAGYGAPVELMAPTPEAFGRFGKSVALSGSGGLVVSEDRSTQFGTPASGVLHFFEDIGGGWALQSSLPNPGASSNGFGASVAHGGDVVAVGAPFQAGIGSVYVFRSSGGVWSLEAELSPSDGVQGDRFGENVAIDGERVLVSATRHRVGGVVQGAAYLFAGAGGVWSEVSKVTSAVGSGDLGFGVSLDISGSTAVIGSTQTNNVGATYVYDVAGGVLAFSERLQPAGLGSFATFGHSVAVRGDRLVVGAYQDTVVGNLTGSAWVFERQGGAFVPRQRLVSAGAVSFHGFRVDLDGNGNVAVGQPIASTPGAPPSAGSLAWYSLIDTVGTNYCNAELNSSGRRGGIAGIGSANASANEVELVAYDLPNQSFGFFIASRTQGFAAQPGGSQGNLCLGGAIGRYVGPGQVRNSGPLARFSLVLDLTLTPTPNGLVPVVAGESWNYQAWYRDSDFGVPTSNFTDGLRVDFE